MSYALTRTSMALDQGTLGALQSLAQKWQISKAEVMRRAVQKMKEDAEREEQRQSPLEALAWLQNGGGLSPEEATRLREEVAAERVAKRYWWEE
ncbi:MAG: hypothetical protein ABIT76_12105 [Chthoniobacterales bacterium]